MLDQAVKKLLKKNILAREMVNDTPKYILRSLQVVVDWMNEDIMLKLEMQKRKNENFETFVRSLTIGKKRPEMEYFEGVEGIKTAYKLLLERGNDFVQYGPLTYAANEEHYRDFWVQYFRERRSRGIFARIITHNTPLGRRYQSRDPFEYRKTILVDEKAYPFHFERVIAGDTVACFQMEDERACFIKYPELARNERAFFECLWNKKLSNEPVSADAEGATESPVPTIIDISPKTRVLSFVREFFLSRKSLALIGIFGVISAGITYALYSQNIALNLVRIQERVKSIAATGAPQFSIHDLNEIHTKADISKPEYAKLIYQLNQIRNQNEDIKYVYLIRPQIEDDSFKFIADADSIDPDALFDINGDGKLDAADENIAPGRTYPTPDELANGRYKNPIASNQPYTDQWGTFISGYAPIKDNDGNIIAILGVDIDSKQLEKFSDASFFPILYFVGFFLLFLLIRLAAFNRSIMKELWQLLHIRKVAFIAAIGAVLSLSITYGLYRHTQSIILSRMQDKVLAISTTAAPQFDHRDIDALQVKQDWIKPEQKKVGNQLQAIRAENTDVLFAYIIRKSKADPTKMEFVIDADSINPYANTDDDPTNDVDMNKDGIIDGSPTGSDYQSWPGQPYPTVPPEGFLAYNRPITTSKFYEDQWGAFISGYAPIKNPQGEVSGILAIDMSPETQHALTNEVFAPIYVFLMCFVIFLVIRRLAFVKIR